MELDESRVTAFWEWFRRIADELGEDLRNEAIHDEIDRRLEGLGDVQWELGPGEREPYFLAISPDGDPDLLPLTRQIVALAPPIDGWEFLPARPARGPVDEFTMEGTRGQEITVRTGRWRYTLLRYPDGMLHVVLEQGAIEGADEGERYAAASLFLCFALGEEQLLLRIAKIEPVESMDEDDARSSHNVDGLRDHLDSLGG